MRRRVRIDGRYRPAQEIKRRIAAYRKAIGASADELSVKARVVELAEIETLTSQLRADGLNGEPVDLRELARLMNMANRMRASLGLADPPPEPEPPTLEELRRQRDAQRAKEGQP